MKDKEKQIEEMARNMCDSEIDCKTCMNVNGNIYQHEPKDCGCWKNAERLINKKYVKLPENSVVLSKEEYYDLYSTKYDVAPIQEALDKKARQTAEKFAKEMLSWLEKDDIDGRNCVIEVAKQFGVEIKDIQNEK